MIKIQDQSIVGADDGFELDLELAGRAKIQAQICAGEFHRPMDLDNTRQDGGMGKVPLKPQQIRADEEV